MFISLIYNANNIKNNFYTVFEPTLYVHVVIHKCTPFKNMKIV